MLGSVMVGIRVRGSPRNFLGLEVKRLKLGDSFSCLSSLSDFGCKMPTVHKRLSTGLGFCKYMEFC